MIEIKYASGVMQIVPHRFFNSPSATAEKFRKLVKLSAESDLIYGTDAVKSWTEIVDDELYLLSLEIKVEKNVYEASDNLKKLERRKRKFERFKEILENVQLIAQNEWRSQDDDEGVS